MRVIKCIMGNSNHTLKMADTDNFLEIIDDNQKRTCLLHKLYTVIAYVISNSLGFQSGFMFLKISLVAYALQTPCCTVTV